MSELKDNSQKNSSIGNVTPTPGKSSIKNTSLSKNKTNKNTIEKKAVKKSTVKKKAIKKNIVKKKTIKKKSSDSKKTGKEVKNNQTPKDKVIVEKKDETIIFDAVLVINEVKSLHQKLLSVISSNKAIVLDTSNVEMVDTATIQLFLSFIASIQKNNIDFKWHNPSDELLERATILNLTEALCLGGINNA